MRSLLRRRQGETATTRIVRRPGEPYKTLRGHDCHVNHMFSNGPLIKLLASSILEVTDQ